MARIKRLTWTNRCARTPGRHLAASCAAIRAVIMAFIVLMAATGLAGFTWIMTGPAAAAATATATPTAVPKAAGPLRFPLVTGPGVHYGMPPRVSVPGSGTAMASIVGVQAPAARPGWLFNLIGAVANSIFVLLTAVLVFAYFLLRNTTAELHVRRSTGGGRSGRPGRDEYGAGQAGGGGARQMTVEPIAPGGIAAEPGTEVIRGTFNWPFSPDEPTGEPAPREGNVFAFLGNSAARPAGNPEFLDLPAPTPYAPVSSRAQTGYRTRLAEVHQVVSGGDRIRITLAGNDAAPELVTDLSTPNGRRYRHHLAWAPFPDDAPQDGVAFACLGSSDRGSLFLDLGRAPSTVTIGGDPRSVTRLAASIAHQLCTTSDGTTYTVVIIGDALPKPQPPTATWLASVDRLGSALAAYPSRAIAIVFCGHGNMAGAPILTDHRAGARCRVVPVMLNEPAEGLWSITATPSPRARASRSRIELR